jgi:hypothetical protein
MSFFHKFNLDFVGFAASFVCAIHCLAIPIFISIGISTSTAIVHDHTFDLVIIGIGIIVAVSSLFTDIKKHNSYLPLSIIVIGFCVLLFSIQGHHDWKHAMISVLGSGLVASAHYINWKKVRNISKVTQTHK